MPKRYFEELAADKKCQPGVVSSELKQALGLHDDKLPIWIYRMRLLGYPPGWLKVADMSKTVMPLLDGSKETTGHYEEDAAPTYNVDSLIVYPGFNAEVPPGVRDDWRYLRMPPMMEHQQLGYATERMNRPKAVPYKRFKFAYPDGEKSPEKSCIEKTSDEPKVEKEFHDDSEIQTVGLNQTSTDLTQDESQPQVANSTSSSLSINESEDTKEKSEVKNSSFSKKVSIGTPVPESYKKKKPALEKWSENDTLPDLIYFENLPNSTGVFDKMRGIIGKVRNRLFGADKNGKEKDEEESSQTT